MSRVGARAKRVPDPLQAHVALVEEAYAKVFLDPETFEPFLPSGEVYDLTRWLPITPEKVDR